MNKDKVFFFFFQKRIFKSFAVAKKNALPLSNWKRDNMGQLQVSFINECFP